MGIPDRKALQPFTAVLWGDEEEQKRLPTEKLTRLEGNRSYRIRVDVNHSLSSRVFLSGNLEGEEFKSYPMTQCQDNRNCWVYEGMFPVGGFLSLTFFMENDEGRFWDPCGYRNILVDPPLMNNLRMYSFIPGVSGRYTHWIKDLDHIREMGFNAIHLLPLTEMGYTRSPYAAKDLFSIDESYGTEEEFERFVNACIEKEIALCFDVVLNHVSCDSRMALTKANWIKGDLRRRDGMKRAGCWHEGQWISWEELVLIDYQHPDPRTRREIWDSMRDYLFHWASLAEKTGGFIRLDNLHSSHQGFIHKVLRELRYAYPRVGIFSEFFHSLEELHRGVSEWGLNLLLANSWEYPFVPQLIGYLKEIHSSAELRFLLMPTTHDTESVTRLFGDPRSLIPRYFVCALMGTGQAGLMMGTEWGEPEKIDFINRSGRMQFNRAWDFSETLGKINKLHREVPLFHKTGNIEFLPTTTDSLIVCRREGDGSRRKFLLAANFDIYNEREFHYNERVEVIMEAGGRLEGKEWGSRIILSPCGVVVLEI